MGCPGISHPKLKVPPASFAPSATYFVLLSHPKWYQVPHLVISQVVVLYETLLLYSRGDSHLTPCRTLFAYSAPHPPHDHMHILIWRSTGAESANKVLPKDTSQPTYLGGYEYWAIVALDLIRTVRLCYYNILHYGY